MSIEYRNQSSEYYDETKTVFSKTRRRPLVNIFTSYTQKKQSFGTVFGFHGFGGAPISDAIYNIKDQALDSGFDFVAIEAYGLSSITIAELSTEEIRQMSLFDYRYAMHAGVSTALRNPRLNRDYRIAFAHCFGCNLVIGNYMSSNHGNGIFNEYVLVAPCLIPNLILRENQIMRQDPSGKTMERIKRQESVRTTEYFGVKYTMSQDCALIENIMSELPKIKTNEHNMIDCPEYVATLLNQHRFQESFKNKPVTLILPMDDDFVDYASMSGIYNELPFDCKSIIRINGGDHSMRKCREQYKESGKIILNRAKNQILQRATHNYMFDITL